MHFAPCSVYIKFYGPVPFSKEEGGPQMVVGAAAAKAKATKFRPSQGQGQEDQKYEEIKEEGEGPFLSGKNNCIRGLDSLLRRCGIESNWRGKSVSVIATHLSLIGWVSKSFLFPFSGPDCSRCTGRCV